MTHQEQLEAYNNWKLTDVPYKYETNEDGSVRRDSETQQPILLRDDNGNAIKDESRYQYDQFGAVQLLKEDGTLDRDANEYFDRAKDIIVASQDVGQLSSAYTGVIAMAEQGKRISN